MPVEKTKSRKKKAAVGVAATAAASGVLLCGVFDSPTELLIPVAGEDSNSPASIMETLACQSPDALPDSGDGEDGDVRRHRLGAVRRRLQSLPLAVRALVGIPLWCLGWALTETASLLWQAAMTPLGGRILSWLLAAGAAVLVYVLTAKALFPNAPWKKILRPRNLLIVLGGMLLLGAADTLLSVFWADYPPIGRLVRLMGGALLLAMTVLSARRLMGQRGRARKGTPSPTSVRTEVEQQAMALANSVCPPSAPRS